MNERVVILRAGFGGLELATILSAALGDEIDVLLIDKGDAFVFGFSKLDLMFGRTTRDRVTMPYGDIAKPGVRVVRETVTAIDPESRRVTTDAGVHDADLLVIALGADYDMDATPGLAEGGNEFYSVAGAQRLAEIIPTFSRGHAVIAVCGAPFKCPPAPSECALLLHDALTARGVRDDCQISFVLPLPSPVPPSPETSAALASIRRLGRRKRALWLNPTLALVPHLTAIGSIDPRKDALTSPGARTGTMHMRLRGSGATSVSAQGGSSGAAPGRASEPSDTGYLSRYGKRADLIVHEQEPLNAETGPAALAEGPLTATDAFYVRGHGPVPRSDLSAWRLQVHGLVERELELSLSTLREAFEERHVTATLQCAGNRRAGLMAIRDIPGEASWGPGATGTAKWTGVALTDVLALANPLSDAMHVGFEGTDLCSQGDSPERFGGSIPLDKACRPEVLLAWGMNGEPLPLVHGAPLRVVVPGYIGARSVKWLERIEVRSTAWPGYFQHVAYRLLPEDATPGPGVGMPLGLIALNADVLSPADGETVAAGPVEVRGYAFAGGERHVARVDVSVDGRPDWSQAELLEDLGSWAWRQWRATLVLAPGEHEIVVRAWDSSAATQPENEAALWNPKGYVNNARPRVRVRAV